LRWATSLPVGWGEGHAVAALDIFLFGVGRIRHQAVNSAADLPPSIRALLGYLVLNRNQSHHRDVLANEFWSEVDDACARNRLSTRLWRLRRVLEPAGVTAGSYLIASRQGHVGFNACSDHWLDVATFEEAATRLTEGPADTITRPQMEAFEQAAIACHSDLLEGVDLPWLVIERERLSQLYAAANLRALEWYERENDLDRAIAAGRRILQRDPLREDVHRRLIRLFCRSNQRSKAARQFDDCRTILREELGVLPLPETVAAAAEISRPSFEPRAQPLEIQTAVELIESASRALGLAARELDAIIQSIRELTSSQ
jgi:DNA-binding SARP family transcriptional activator